MSHVRMAAIFWFGLAGIAAGGTCLKSGLSSGPMARHAVQLDVNDVRTWVINDGTLGRDPVTGNAGFEFPAGSGKTVAYATGLWISGLVSGAVRTACADYNTEFQPGQILPDGSPADPQLPIYRVYKIRPGDSANPSSPQYNPDYAEWPAAQGAPTNPDGSPMVIGDVTLWYVMNDANQNLHNLAYHTKPLNVEVQVLAWAFSRPGEALNSTVFVEYTIINKGKEPIENAYVGIFADPDVGDANDDGSACDTTLDLSYAYNRRLSDRIYGMRVPAWGVALLQGPVVPAPGHTASQFRRGVIQDAKNLRVSANVAYYCAHPIYRDPPYSQQGARQLHNNMQGLHLDGNPFIDPVTGRVTTFMNTGDPIARTGWLDDLITPPCDVHFVQATGPFSLAPLDTQRIIYAYSVASAMDPLLSIVDLRREVGYARAALLSGFAVDVTNAMAFLGLGSHAKVGLRVKVESRVGVCAVDAEFFDYSGVLLHRMQLYDDGAHEDAHANDGFYGNTWETPPRDKALRVDLHVLDEHGRDHVFAHILGAINLAGLDEGWRTLPPRIVADHMNSDGIANPGEVVKFQVPVVNLFGDSVRVLDLVAFCDDPAVDTLIQGLRFESIGPGDTVGVNHDPCLMVRIKPDLPNGKTLYVGLSLFDSEYRWQMRSCALPIRLYTYVPNELVVYEEPRRSEAYFKIRVVDPGKLTGHAYTITVCDSINEQRERGFNLWDQTLGQPLLLMHPLPDEYAFNIPVTDGFKVVQAYLPKGELRGVSYHDVPGGAPAGLSGVNRGWPFFDGGVRLGRAPTSAFCEVELEFVNALDTSGVIGPPRGQLAFRYLPGTATPGTGPYRSPFRAWKVFGGERIGLLNVCFQELATGRTADSVWAPDASSTGGLEVLYIMATDYDSSGTIYRDRPLSREELLYEVSLRLTSPEARVDAGDMIFFDWEYPASPNAQFVFVPTNVGHTEKAAVARVFRLWQNYPNPFNQGTKIRFVVGKPGVVNLSVWNAAGREVAKLRGGWHAAGDYTVSWDGRDHQGRMVSSGVYFARLTAGQEVATIKMLLLR
ncbi:MAG: T9SS type A sorting domain-containing protein [candidate division KSB1 bacterium]|nr:T9SS type A sorting domain-containing protein [candidate division KSB1 bacterium]